MNPFRVSLVVSLLGVIESVAAPAAEREQAIWSEPGESVRVRFIAESGFHVDSGSLEQTAQTRALNEAVSAATLAFERSSTQGPGACLDPPHDASESSERSPVDRVLTDDVAIVGTVKGLISGWNRAVHRAGTLVEIEVDEVLRDRADLARAGDRVTYLQTSGAMSLDGAYSCTKEYPGMTPAALGERRLLIGRWSALNPGHLLPSHLMLIRDDTLIAQPSGVTGSLRSLRAEVQALQDRYVIARARDQAAHEYALWRDLYGSSGLEVSFLPERYLDPGRDSLNRDAGPDAESKVILEAVRDAREHIARYYPSRLWKCAPPVHADCFCEPPKPRSAAEMILAAETALVGTVTRLLGGWGVHYHRPATLVEVRIDDVLRDESMRLRRLGVRGDPRLTWQQDSGTIDVSGQVVCSDNYPGFRDAQVGDRLLIGGTMSLKNSNHLNRHFTFVIQGDELIPEPADRPIPGSRSLKAVLRELRATELTRSQ